MRQGAIDLYLRVYTDFVASETAALALERLMALAPEAVSPAANFKPLLRRAENLIRSGKNAEARAQLLKLNAVPAPDRSSAREVESVAWSRLSTILAIPGQRSRIFRVSKTTMGLFTRNLCIFRRSLIAGCRKRPPFSRSGTWRFERYPESSFTEKILHSVATYFDVKNQPARADQAYRTMAGKILRRRACRARSLENSAFRIHRRPLRGGAPRLLEISLHLSGGRLRRRYDLLDGAMLRKTGRSRPRRLLVPAGAGALPTTVTTASERPKPKAD